MATSKIERVSGTTTSAPARPALRAVSTELTERIRQFRYFVLHLRASTNSRGVPFHEKTIEAYSDAVISLDKYLDRIGVGDLPRSPPTSAMTTSPTTGEPTARAGP